MPHGIVVVIGEYVGENVRDVVGRLLTERPDDGGWNCDVEIGSTRSSFHDYLCLVQDDRLAGASAVVTASRHRPESYLLERRMLRLLSTGEMLDPDFARFSFSNRSFCDALRGLD